ncbi:hypothetical protein EDC56_2510 [Sinobacterium caligoides]|uniref:Carboxypeptidase-like regulatory domain-containing protein n=1 Tax=Sinobacterium caligoides TaxID=933926 RepID=A0A3N2DQI3_9GAMM|nr:hypothetical protein [Sinobacterium caligoides]ROS02060.1 hypothetical protein EDC56_2510 [Sinobacterium caligoides]
MARFIFIFFLSAYSLQVFAYEQNAYAKPIQYAGFVDDVSSLVTRVTKNGWQISEQKSGLYSVTLNYKGYAINTAITDAGSSLTIQLISADRLDCKKCTVDDEKVQGWLLRMRKLIAREVTEQARDAAREALKPASDQT